MPRPLLVLCLLTLLRRPPHVAVNAWPAAGLDVVANAADCALVRPIFEARNASATRATIPRGTPIDGTSLKVCKAEYSCCTFEMESNLKILVKKEYVSSVQRNAQSVQGLLASTAIHFQDYVRHTMAKAESRTLRLFGQMFGQEAAVASDEHVRHFFGELVRRMRPDDGVGGGWQTDDGGGGGGTRFAGVTESFFARLFPHAYEATLERRQRLHAEYVDCLRTRMDAIFPATEAVRALERDVAATLEATRVLVAALELGARALNSSNVAALSEWAVEQPGCGDALPRLAYCGLCAGQAPKPCSGYCASAMRGCAAQLTAELDSHWSAYYEAMRKLVAVVNRGQSLVCLEDLLASLVSRIAEPMLTLSENSEHVHLKAKFFCGQTKWANDSSTAESAGAGAVATAAGQDERRVDSRVAAASAVAAAAASGAGDWSMDDDDSKLRSTLLANKIRQLEESEPPRSAAFYSDLAEAPCREDAFAETRPNAACWTGQRVAAENSKTTIASTRMPSQKYNRQPSLPVQITATATATVDAAVHPRIADLLDRLARMKRLVQSHTATGMQSPPESESLYQAAPPFEDGSGSGDGRMSPDSVGDDEDAITGWQEQGSGSGDSAPAVTQVPDSDSEADAGPVEGQVSVRTLFDPDSSPPPPPQQRPPPPPPSFADGSGVRIASANPSSPPPPPPKAGCACLVPLSGAYSALLFASAVVVFAA